VLVGPPPKVKPPPDAAAGAVPEVWPSMPEDAGRVITNRELPREPEIDGAKARLLPVPEMPAT